MTAVVATIAMAVAFSARAEAAFPGLNGRIAYTNSVNEFNSIWSVNPDGTAPAQLTAGPSDYGPAYSADGTRIAFNQAGNLYVMNADGTGQTQLAAGSESFSSEIEWIEKYEGEDGEEYEWVQVRSGHEAWSSLNGPSFSPDGSQLAVAASKNEWQWESICAVENKGDENCIEEGEPGAYFEYHEGCVECTSNIITVSAASGAKVADVTPPSQDYWDYDPSFAADGRIAFDRWSNNPSTSAIYVAAPGAAPVPVTSGSYDESPDFSPDGTKIVFNRGEGSLAIVGSAGGPVTAFPIPAPPNTEFSFLGTPKFSPDGTRIVFYRSIWLGGSETSERGLFTIAPDGTGLAKFLDNASNPSWQPVPPPPPPVPAQLVKSKKKKIKLDKKGKAVVGTIVCGSTPCALKGLKAELTVKPVKGASKSDATASKKKGGKGKKGKAKPTYKVGLQLAKSLAPGKTGKVTVKVSGKALTALKAAGKGALNVKVQVTDATGKQAATFKPTLLPAPEKAKKGKGKGKSKGGKGRK